MYSMAMDDLYDVEVDLWYDHQTRAPVSKHRVQVATAAAVRGYRQPTQTRGPSQEISLSDFSKWEVVDFLDRVQEVKVACISEGQFKIGGGLVDPCPLNISYQGKSFRIYSTYDGKESSKQPGNMCLVEIQQDGTEKCYTYDTELDGPNPMEEDPHVELLLLTEISRRHAEDVKTKKKDEFRKLPVGVGITMASALIQAGEIPFESFWGKGGDHHFFTGNKRDREGAIEGLYQVYADSFLKEFLSIEDFEAAHLLESAMKYFGE